MDVPHKLTPKTGRDVTFANANLKEFELVPNYFPAPCIKKLRHGGNGIKLVLLIGIKLDFHRGFSYLLCGECLEGISQNCGTLDDRG